MNENLTPEEQQELLRIVKEQEKELEELRNNNGVVQQSSQEFLFQVLLEKGGPLVTEYLKINAQSNQYATDKSIELEKEELKIIDKLDTKEKYYKGILLVVCLLALIASAYLIERAEMVIPVLSLIIGLLFKSNSLSDFFSHAKRKLNNGDDE
jgi:hypothetical protein